MAAETQLPTAIELFYSYAHSDAQLCIELRKHLSALKRSGLIRDWYDREIEPGGVWNLEIQKAMERAGIILLLISADFLESKYIFEVELPYALKRHDSGAARVIPVLLRPVEWRDLPFAKLQMLPSEARPVTLWPNQDQAFSDVASTLRELIYGDRLRTTSQSRATDVVRTFAQGRVLDAAIGSCIVIDEPTDVVTMVRTTQSNGLKAILSIERMYSPISKDVRSQTFELEFPLDEYGTPRSSILELALEAPGFEPPMQTKKIRIPPKGDSGITVFMLTPRRTGKLRLNLQAIKGDVEVSLVALASTCVQNIDAQPTLSYDVMSVPVSRDQPTSNIASVALRSSRNYSEFDQSSVERVPFPLGVFVNNGGYLPSLTQNDLRFIEPPSQQELRLTRVSDVARIGFPDTISPYDLKESGWGIVFSGDMDPFFKREILSALDPLIQLRKSKAGGAYWEGGRFRIFDNELAYHRGDDAYTWLMARGSNPTVNPALGVPYYLMLVGSPSEIPFKFQKELDSAFAVGRLYFETAAEFAQYAKNIVTFETSSAPQNKNIALFCTRIRGDQATRWLHDGVAIPLLKGSADSTSLGSAQGFKVTPFLAEDATKDNLTKLLRGDTAAGSPALLYTGSHGAYFDMVNPDLQEQKLGSLLTQDWAGQGEPVTENTFFSGDDVPNTGAALGTIHFLFTCYGAGCPQFDTYSHDGDHQIQIARQTMLTRLPQRLLVAGTQAVIGHVDRAWVYPTHNRASKLMFRSILDPMTRLLRGMPVGAAMDVVSQLQSTLSMEVIRLLDHKTIDPGLDSLLADSWIARDHMGNQIVFGDPAAHLRT